MKHIVTDKMLRSVRRFLSKNTIEVKDTYVNRAELLRESALNDLRKKKLTDRQIGQLKTTVMVVNDYLRILRALS
jgi:hypothetical protein